MGQMYLGGEVEIDPELLKKYRAFITRRSKWEAIKLCIDHDQAGARALREIMLRAGVPKSDLDEKWEKKILGDTKLFRLKSGEFFELADDLELGKRPHWSGERPGQSYVKDAYLWAIDHVPHVDPEDVRNNRSMLGDMWDPYAEFIVRALDGLRKREVEEPLAKLHQMAWTDSILFDINDHPVVHAVAKWLTLARGDVCAYTRLRAYIAGGDRPHDVLGPEDGYGSPVYVYATVGFKRDDGGGYEEIQVDVSPDGVLRLIKSILVRRRIMRGG